MLTAVSERIPVVVTALFAALSLHAARIDTANADPAATPVSPRLVFVGNHAFSSSELRAAIDWPFDASGAVLQETFERDLLLVSSFYWDHGYANVKVGESMVSPTQITIPIDEGAKFSIGAVTATGDLLEPEATTLGGLRTHEGDIFSRTKIADDRAELEEHYQDRGYAYVSILPFTHVDLAKRTIAIRWEIARGKRSFVEDIEVDARTQAEAAAIRRALPMSAGDQFSQADLHEAKRRAETIAGTQVVISTKHGSTDELVKVGVEVPRDQ
jgi:outer membrane protein insertion porin family